MLNFPILQGIVILFENPSQLADLKKAPSLAPAFVEELCRFHTASAMATRRVAKVDITLGGKVRIIALLFSPSTDQISRQLKLAKE
jgi:cytochrome P450